MKRFPMIGEQHPYIIIYIMPYLYIIVFDSHGIDNLYFESLSQLKYLDLSNCTIGVLPEQIFRANTMLEELRKENIKAMFPSYNYYIICRKLVFISLCYQYCFSFFLQIGKKPVQSCSNIRTVFRKIIVGIPRFE